LVATLKTNRKDPDPVGNFDDARAEVQRAFDAAMACADTSEKQSFFEFERNLWALLLALGRALADSIARVLGVSLDPLAKPARLEPPKRGRPSAKAR
jgi:hypothetical protein